MYAKEDNPMYPAMDRRQTPRIDTAIRAEILDGSGWLVAHDIGLGGMQATTKTLRWPGSMIQVRFHLPGEANAVRVTCRILELTEAPAGVGMSLQFLRLAPDAHWAIRRYLGKKALRVVPTY